MTLEEKRTMYACAAMQATIPLATELGLTCQTVARDAFKYADAMLAEEMAGASAQHAQVAFLDSNGEAYKTDGTPIWPFGEEEAA